MKSFLAALMFYTRIPVPRIRDYSDNIVNTAIRYFSFVGWIVGAISYGVFVAAELAFGVNIAVILSLVAGVLTTGCFHEDGFADMADGFGGGTSKSKILDIMKDSRIGSFGTIALILLFGLKFFALVSIFSRGEIEGTTAVPLVFITYHSLARFVSGNMVFVSKYARDDGTNKIKPVEKSWTWREVVGLYLFGLAPLMVCVVYHWQYCLVLIPLAIILLGAKKYFERRIGGYTGDCLGAIEQISEITILLYFVVLLKIL